MILLNDYLKKEFGTKVYKLSLNTGCTCPNRDGKISYGGCTFCSGGGSGEFTFHADSIYSQIERAKNLIASKLPKSIEREKIKYIAYFQSFSNTYAVSKEQEADLMNMFSTVSKLPEIAVISIATRPDCISDPMLEFLSELNKVKPVWIELGLQTVFDKTAETINRGYKLCVFEDMYKKLKEKNLTVIVHVILGLPGETEKMNLQTVSYLSCLSPTLDGIKIQLLQILKGTKMYEQYKKEPFKIFTLEEYTDLLLKCLKILPPKTVVHRLTGDGPKKLLAEPLWCADKKRVLNYIIPKVKNLFSC